MEMFADVVTDALGSAIGWIAGLGSAGEGRAVGISQEGREPTPSNQLERLSAAQRARLQPFAAEWIEHAWCATPLTDQEWARWETGAKKCYEGAGLTWPGVVIRVSSPIVGALLPTVVAKASRRLRRSGSRASEPVMNRAIDDAIRSELRSPLPAPVRAGLHTAARQVLDTTGFSMTVLEPASGIAPVLDESFFPAVSRRVKRTILRTILPSLLNGEAAIWGAILAEIRAVSPGFHRPTAGRGMSAWAAFIAFCRDELDVPIDQNVRDRSRAFEDTLSAGCWWAFRDVVLVCDAPIRLHVEFVDGAGQLHNASGPAVCWADGWCVHVWHGTRVPADLTENGWGVDQIMAERNAEIRRCAIERMGWDRFVVAGMKLADEAADPANPGQVLRLYDVPRKLLGSPIRVLLCDNATREPDGSRHRFGLTVPAECHTALAAAAWTFDLPESVYQNLVRAT